MGSEEGRSSRGSRPSSRSGHVTSFLDDIQDNFEPEPSKETLHEDDIGEERRVYLQSDNDGAESKTTNERESADTQLDEVKKKTPAWLQRKEVMSLLKQSAPSR